MFIYVACAGGMSASLFSHRMTNAIKSQDENLTVCETDIEKAFRDKLTLGNEYDLVLAYGPVDDIRAYNAFEYGQLFDVVYIAPQVSYMIPQKEEILKRYPTIVKAIPSLLFGRLDAENAYNMLLGELIDLDIRRGYESNFLAAGKNSDKDIEIYVAGASHDDPFFKYLFAFLEKMDIRSAWDKYSLETLYDFNPTTDVDIRFVFGQISTMEKTDFAKIGMRIDGLAVSPTSALALIRRRSWMADYQIPVWEFDDEHFKKDLKRGLIGEQMQDFLEFLLKIEPETEYSREISVERFENGEKAVRRNFGFLSWNSKNRKYR